MNIENAYVTLDIPIEFNKPNKNGTIYTEEIIENMIKEFFNAPIIYTDERGNRHDLGVADIGFVGDSSKGTVIIDIKPNIELHTSLVFKNDTEEKIVEIMHILGASTEG